jgi:hypothetical protein
MIGSEYANRELDRFIAEKIMETKGVVTFTAEMGRAWQVVEKMMRKYFLELKLDVFRGVSGDLWVASFYSPTKCQRFESKGHTAPMAICKAAKEAFVNISGG